MYGGNYKTPIWVQIRAFWAGSIFRAKCLLSIEYVILRGNRTCPKIIEFGLQSEFAIPPGNWVFMRKACQPTYYWKKWEVRFIILDKRQIFPPCMQKFPFEHQLLKKWFIEHKRDLPWRDSPSPYSIWVSEIMLQQTQASVVVDYFIRWMERFPTIRSLAESSLELVLKMWEGLGYYSRARHLHEAARYFLEQHEGNIPADREELEKVKGLGPYTIGAILSFAFHLRSPAVDANVARVLARYFCIEEDISPRQSSARRWRIWEIAEQILPDEEP